MKRVRRTRSEYEALLARKEAEGLTYKQLASSTGVPESTLVLWLTRIRKERASKPAFIELRAEPVSDAMPSAGVHVVLDTGHHVVVEQGFDDDTLRRVINALSC